MAVVTTATAPKVSFTDTRLTNGLRVIIAEDHTAPVFSIAVSYNLGSRDERKGRTGFAHLFEHMMFQGLRESGPGEHFTLVSNNGGQRGWRVQAAAPPAGPLAAPTSADARARRAEIH